MEEQDYEIETNPAARFKRSWKTKSYKPWTDEQCATFEKSGAPPHLLTAYFLARYTGQRRGDILAMLRRTYDAKANEIKVKPSKTAKLSKSDDDDELTIPVHSRLRAYLATLPNDALLFVVHRRGRSFADREESFSKEFRAALNAAGLSELHFHGLRHTAATALAEAGCSVHQIMAVTGHKTMSMVQKYTARADQKRNAKAAMAKLDRTGTEQESAKLDE